MHFLCTTVCTPENAYGSVNDMLLKRKELSIKLCLQSECSDFKKHTQNSISGASNLKYPQEPNRQHKQIKETVLEPFSNGEHTPLLR